MNKSSNGIPAVVIVIVLLIGIGLYLFLSGTTTVPVVVTQTATTTPVVPPPTTTPTTTTPTATTTTTTTATSTPFVLNNAQKQALIKLGISSSSIPATITMTQETCFINALGAPRVIEIKAGALPAAIEFAKVKGCFK